MKYIYCYLFITAVGILGCKQISKPTKSATGSGFNIKKVKGLDTVEYINWYTAKINGDIHLATLKKLYNLIGRPDSIVKVNGTDGCAASYFDEDFKYIYIKGSEFELKDDSIVVSDLNFRGTNLKLSTNNLSLDSSTTLESLKKIFPRAVSAQYEVTTNNKKQMAIMLGTSKKAIYGDTDNTWILFFEKGKLVEIEHHYDC